jgi:hypothetical protein
MPLSDPLLTAEDVAERLNVPLRGSHCAAYPGYLSQILWVEMSAFLLATSYLSMAMAALAVEFIFGALHLIPRQRTAQIVEESIHWNYTTVLNIIFLMLAVVLVFR